MEQLKQLLTAAGIAYKENEPLAAHCTFKIGGPARLFVQPADRAQLCRAVALCKAQGVRYYLLGNGSNILFADKGYNGVVLDISSMQDTVEVHGTQLTAGAGVRLSALCKTALEHGRTGICLWHPRYGGRRSLHERRSLRRRDEGCADHGAVPYRRGQSKRGCGSGA